ncbi:MAG: hypothetical protein AB7O26_16455, partial [Planctomycetaceae bacterium]
MSIRHCLRAAAVTGLIVLSTNSSQAQGISLTGLRMWTGHPVSPVVLAGVEPVQKELALKDDQVAKANALMLEHREAFISEFQSAGFDLQGLQNLSEDERQKKFAEFQTRIGEIGKSLHDKFSPKLADILDTAQRTRLAELDHQCSGAQALHNAEIAKQLELTKEQQAKLDSLAKDFSGRIIKLFNGDGDRE